MKDLYGPDKLVDIQLNLDSVGNFQVFEANSTLAFNLGASVNFWVEKDGTVESREKAASINLIDAVIGFEADIVNSVDLLL